MIVLFIVGWILSGLLAVYLAGVVDKIAGIKDAAPIKLLFLLGPIGLFISMMFFLGLILASLSEPNFKMKWLTKIYKVGND